MQVSDPLATGAPDMQPSSRMIDWLIWLIGTIHLRCYGDQCPSRVGRRQPCNYMDYYSFTDPKGMKYWVGLVGWPIADTLPTSGHMSTSDQGKSVRPKTKVLTTEPRCQHTLGGGKSLCVGRTCDDGGRSSCTQWNSNWRRQRFHNQLIVVVTHRIRRKSDAVQTTHAWSNLVAVRRKPTCNRRHARAPRWQRRWIVPINQINRSIVYFL